MKTKKSNYRLRKLTVAVPDKQDSARSSYAFAMAVRLSGIQQGKWIEVDGLFKICSLNMILPTPLLLTSVRQLCKICADEWPGAAKCEARKKEKCRSLLI